MSARKRREPQFGGLWGGAEGGRSRQPTPLEAARAENATLREREHKLEGLAELGQLENENAKLKRQQQEIAEIVSAVQALRNEQPEQAPTQSAVAERLDISQRELERRLKPYKGLWKVLTAPES